MISCSHAEEAQQALAQGRKPIDLLLTDVVRPGLTGPEFYKKIADQHPTMKVLYMSSYTDRGILAQGLLEAGSPYIQKPFRPIDLARKVRAVLDS